RHGYRIRRGLGEHLRFDVSPIEAELGSVILDQRIVSVLRSHHGTTLTHASSASGPWRENAPVMAEASTCVYLTRRLTVLLPLSLLSRPCRPARRLLRQARTP